MSLLTPTWRALNQMQDRVFLAVALRSVAWTGLAGLVLLGGVAWGGHDLAAWLGLGAVGGWLGGAVGGGGAAMLVFVGFVPVATTIASLFSDRIAAAVERHYYPALRQARPAAVMAQAWDGIALGLQVLGLQIVAVLLALLLPGPGLALGWAVAAWAIGRGLFVAVAMRRMDRAAAVALYARHRAAVLAQGAIMAAAGLVPFVNLVAPVLAVAAMVHVLHAPASRVVPPPSV